MKLFCKRGLCLLLMLILCAGLLSGLTVNASAATLEERQQAVVAAALAYYDKGHSVQYEGTNLCDNIDRVDYGKSRSTYHSSPETATPDETMYTVCSDFAYQVYYEALGYKLLGNEGRCWTGSLGRYPKNDPIVVWYYDGAEGKNRAEELQKMFQLAQPGDIITVFAKTSGHTMIWAGDLTGDGVADIIHSGGAHMKNSLDKRTDTREYNPANEATHDPRYEKKVLKDGNGGSIHITGDAANYIPGAYKKKTWRRWTLLRPANAMTDSDPIPAKTLYRMSHPRLAIDRTLSKTRFGSAYTGETVTMTLKLSNASKVNYTVPVTEKSPAGAKLKTPFSGANVSGETQTLNVELAAGETKTFVCEYEITALLGEKVVFEGGSVGDIPSNSIPITVGGAKLNADDTAKLAKVAAGEYESVLRENKADNATMADVVYQKILGLNVRIPDFVTITSKCTKPVMTPEITLTDAAKTVMGSKRTHVFLKQEDVKAEDLTLCRMMVPNCWWGASMWCPFGSDRCSEPLDKHLEPGDVIVRSKSYVDAAQSEQMIYLGNGKYLTYDKDKNAYAFVEEPEFFMCVTYKIFYVLRPTLAYDDVHALPALPAAEAKTLKFTDVKEGDWYYGYVKDLVARGTISGMTETTFAPNGTLTYGQALKLVASATGEKEPAKSGSHWASGYLTLAKEKKWLDKDIDLDSTVTRRAFCQIAAKARNITAQPKKNPFKDTQDKDVLALVKAGVVSGMTDTTFEPDGLLTRAQIAKIIWALLAA